MFALDCVSFCHEVGGIAERKAVFCFVSSNLKLIKTPGWAKKGRLLAVVQGSPALRLKHVVPKIPAITTAGWCHQDQFGRRSTCTKCMLKPLFTVEKNFPFGQGITKSETPYFQPFQIVPKLGTKWPRHIKWVSNWRFLREFYCESIFGQVTPCRSSGKKAKSWGQISPSPPHGS